MLKGKNVQLSLIDSEEELFHINKLSNNLEERSIYDHTEIFSDITRLETYKRDGLWSNTAGILKITIEENNIIGIISFKKTTDLELSLGYRIFKNDDRNHGYMTEALSLFSVYLFTTIPSITRLALLTAEDNSASRRLAKKCHFQNEGILREAYFYRGKICNWALYSLLRSEIKDL